jgi:dUTP pyrophosphatase
MKLKIKRLTPDAILPTYAHDTDAGMDLYASMDIELFRHHPSLVPTGLAIEIPEGYFGLLRPRSGLATKHGIISCSSGIIDSGYRGEIHAGLMNASDEAWSFRITKGMRMAQLIIVPYIKAEFEEVEELSETLRGNGGHGSTGL